MLLVLQLQCVNSGIVLSDSDGDGGSDCPMVRTDLVDVQSKAYVSDQVIEATVQGEVPQVPSGQPYQVSFVVSRSLRRYRGPGRIKKQATLTLTFRRPDPENAAKPKHIDSDDVGDHKDCLVSTVIKPRRKYVLFLSSSRGASTGGASGNNGVVSGATSSPGPGGLGTVMPVAVPVPASKKLRRIIKKIACSKCGK